MVNLHVTVLLSYFTRIMNSVIEVNNAAVWCRKTQGLYSLSGKTSYHKISWSLEAARFGFKLFQSLWNLAGISAALLPRCLSNFRAIQPLQHPISRLRDFTRFDGKTSYRLVNRGPGYIWLVLSFHFDILCNHQTWWVHQALNRSNLQICKMIHLRLCSLF